MQTPTRPGASTARIHSYHGTKHQILGNQAGQTPPAWRVANPSGPYGSKDKLRLTEEVGSKILLSRLPTDVPNQEVEDLFKKTVGPLKECFLVYNSQGNSKGMAIVSFQRPGDALVAQNKFNGKIIDGRRPIKIEIISDQVTHPAPTPSLTLADRLGKASPVAVNDQPVKAPRHPRIRTTAPQSNSLLARTAPQPATAAAVHQKRRQKKGPRRIKKSAEEMDKEMEEYRAASARFDFKDGLMDVTT